LLFLLADRVDGEQGHDATARPALDIRFESRVKLVLRFGI
jgi:hypothetical protein